MSSFHLRSTPSARSSNCMSIGWRGGSQSADCVLPSRRMIARGSLNLATALSTV